MYRKLKELLKKVMLIQMMYNLMFSLYRNVIAFVSNMFSVKDNKILVQAYHGKQFSCNPKYIANYIQEKNNNKFVIYVAIQDLEKYDFLKIAGYKLVRSYSLAFYYHYITSKIIIFNDSFPILIKRKRNQLLINTWHGCAAYKKVGISLSKNKYYTQRYKWKHDVNYMISCCKEATKAMVEAFDIEKEKILEFGMPRNDIMINSNTDHYKEKIYKHYNLSKNKKIVLYAPTYRLSRKNSLYDLDFKMLINALSKRFGGEWVIFFRGHYFLEDNKNMNKENIINVSDYNDMQELLCSVDCLVTDYSSSVWDYSFTYKPCFLYATDLENYKSEVDFYYSIDNWPFSLAKNNNELMLNIKNFDYDVYKNKVENHHKILGSFENGNSREQIYDLLIKRG